LVAKAFSICAYQLRAKSAAPCAVGAWIPDGTGLGEGLADAAGDKLGSACGDPAEPPQPATPAVTVRAAAAKTTPVRIVRTLFAGA
jgi:hypothetical protein